MISVRCCIHSFIYSFLDTSNNNNNNNNDIGNFSSYVSIKCEHVRAFHFNYSTTWSLYPLLAISNTPFHVCTWFEHSLLWMRRKGKQKFAD